MKNRDLANLDSQRGITLLELAVAILLLTILVAAWLGFVHQTIVSGRFSQKLADVNALTFDQAGRLIKDADNLVLQVPDGQQSIGSIAPADPIPSYFDLLDENGKPINGRADDKGSDEPPDDGFEGGPGGHSGGPRGGSNSGTPVAKFVRQWLVVKNLPGTGDVAVFVSVKYLQTNQILRISRASRVDGIVIQE
ncbi:MAG: type II secretion system protein [Acidobacteriota bacterium]